MAKIAKTRDADLSPREKLSKAQKERFLEALRKDPRGNVSRAARAAGMRNTRGLYYWREKDPEFAADWDDALLHVFDSVFDAAVERATTGVTSKYVLHEGDIVRHHMHCDRLPEECAELGCPGEPLVEKRYSDSLAAALLKALDRDDRFRDKQSVKHEGGPAVGVIVVPAGQSVDDWQKQVRGYYDAREEEGKSI